MRIAEDAADGGGLGAGIVAITVQSLLTENALSAGDIERHQDVVAYLQLFHVLA
jgi:hypothetical protein